MTQTAFSRRSVLLGSAAALAAGPALAAAATPSARLKALFAASDEAELKRSPLGALFRGDPRYAGQIGDLYADSYDAAGKRLAQKDLAALAGIDRAALTADEQVAYDVFKWQREIDLRGYDPDLLKVQRALAVNHFYGIHNSFAELANVQGAAPFRTVADYEHGLSRLRAMAPVLDRVRARLRQGVADGVTEPRLIMANVVEQLDQITGGSLEESSFYSPVTRFPAEIGAADQARLRAAYAKVAAEVTLPAFRRLRDYIRDQYLPVARETVGLRDVPGGEAYYRYLIDSTVTTPIDPEAVHALGLSEVARIHGEMHKVMAEVGFRGTLLEFFDHIRNDPKFKPASKQALIDGYTAIGERVAPQLPRLFGHIPRTALRILPTPELTEKGAARGSYEGGTADGSRPGVFYFNTYDLPSRTTPGMETLYLHEGQPGHHFQISLAQENTDLPAFMRFGGNTAFVEGWGLYAETLGRELGVFTDPYQYFGHLDSELFRSIRLVVDSGIHAKGWTRDQSIDYILKNSSRGRTNATSETERYIAIPSQALGYKMGQLKIRAARTRAEQALGARFDVRGFHDQVLMTGALPLAVLDAKIDRWVAGQG
ncbi:MAG: DUF885 domain-containing protein [Caulobacteraceae bacterium]|nr:DUF885 domain-containing protein [Caulobacteraceae bacterium]